METGVKSEVESGVEGGGGRGIVGDVLSLHC